MFFSRLFKRRKERREPNPEQEKLDASIPQGVYYLYAIIGAQILFVFAILASIMLIGKVIATPGWVFLAVFLAFIGSLYYIYHKARKKFRKLRESFSSSDLANRNYEISFMGGMLTMKIEQNPNAPKLLEAPASSSSEPIIDTETIEPAANRKQAHLS